MSELPAEKRRFRIDVAYDGRPYSGWQSQSGGETVQDVLLAALQSICSEVSTVQGSGRTDAGVHAERQVAHFDVPSEWRMKGGEWQRALNSHLPAAIRILDCGEIDPDFHARFSAVEKHYRYTIATGEVLPPLSVGVAWHQRNFRETAKLAEALRLYEGEHDFRAFSANRNDGKDAERNAVRTIYEAKVEENGPDSLVLCFRGNGFLYKMVRFLVGTAVYYSCDRITREEIELLLTSGDADRKAPYCAPPDGLTLAGVTYPEKFEIFRG